VKTKFSDKEQNLDYWFVLDRCDFDEYPKGCPDSLPKLVYDNLDPSIELFWYDSEIVLNDKLLDRTPLNPTDAENTYLIKPRKNTHKIKLWYEDDLSTETVITLKYQTNHLEKFLLSTGETTRESFGTLTVDSVVRTTDEFVKYGYRPLFLVEIRLDPDENVTRVV
jgi:hypothetical protein